MKGPSWLPLTTRTRQKYVFAPGSLSIVMLV